MPILWQVVLGMSIGFVNPCGAGNLLKIKPTQGKIRPIGLSLLLDSAGNDIGKSKAIQWPYVYPIYYKYGLEGGFHPVHLPGLSALKSFALGFSGELLWNQVLFFGMAYELDFIPKNKFQKQATIHRVMLNTGFIVSLDDAERNHLLFYFRPGMSNLRTEKGKVTRPGICLGLGYEFAYNSDYYMSPEVMYYRYPILDKYPYGLSGWMVGLRIMRGK